MKIETLIATIGIVASGLASQQTTLFSNGSVFAQPYPGHVTRMILADLDGDGDDDLLTAADSSIRWYERAGGAFGTEHTIATLSTTVQDVATLDVDLDGDLEVVVATYADNTVSFYPNIGAGMFGPRFVISNNVPGARSLASADFDSDGKSDVAAIAGLAGEVVVMRNLGFGFFSPPIAAMTGGGNQGQLTAADVDQDGDIDLIRTKQGAPECALNQAQGSGTFLPCGILYSMPASYPNTGSANHIQMADVDSDGVDELIFAHGQLSYWQRDTYGNYQLGGIISQQDYDDYALADVDHDGDIDMIGTRGSSGYMFAFRRNDGSGSFGPEEIVDQITAPNRVLADDINGDGSPDIVIHYDTSPYGSGGSTLALYNNLFTTSSAQILGIGCGSPAMTMTPTAPAIQAWSMAATINNTPTPVCVIALGTSGTSMPGVGPLPFDLTGAGMPGCSLYSSSELFGLTTQFAGTPFVVNWQYLTPGNGAAYGLKVYTQAFSYAPGANLLEIIASNGVEWVIGNK